MLKYFLLFLLIIGNSTYSLLGQPDKLDQLRQIHEQMQTIKTQILTYEKKISEIDTMLNNIEKEVAELESANSLKYKNKLEESVKPTYSQLKRNEESFNAIRIHFDRVIELYSKYELEKNLIRPFPDERLSPHDLQKTLISKKLFEKNLNPNVTPFNNDFEIDDYKLLITDKLTGLMWQLSGSKAPVRTDGKSDVRYLNSDKYCGFNDWRLPTVEEVLTLLESLKRDGLYVNPAFNRKQKKIFTSDKFQLQGEEYSWIMNYESGQLEYVKSKNAKAFVRAVRSINK